MNDLNSYKATTYDFKKKIEEQSNYINELEQSIMHEKELYNQMEEFYKNKIDFMEQRRIKNRIKNVFKKQKNKDEKQVVEPVVKNDNKPIKKEIVENMPTYNSWYEDNQDFSSYKSDIKPIAFYLPQFHTFKENDEWWGKGFTEWTNTKKSKPRFEGHYQPREPHDDFGYYFLDNEDTIKKQVKLAKEHGLYGFAFYYYWFSGKTLMTKPIDLFLKDKKETFKFCLCWANENWTRRWDGLDKEVLIKQDYTEEDKYNFIKDIKEYITNDRYIKVDDKPLIMVYNPDEIPDYENMIEVWRQTARDLGIGELYIVQKQCIGNYEDKCTKCVDGEFDFAPTGFAHEGCRIECKYTSKAYDYKQLVDDIDHMYKEFNPYKDFYFSSTMGWDNAARRKKDYKVYCNYNPYSFYKWIRYTIRETRRRLPKDKRFIFINAWNEWAEGTYLEPDKKFGYTNINTLSKAVFDIPMSSNYVELKRLNKVDQSFNKKLAIQIHVYYLDVYKKMVELLKDYPYEYDLYITTTDVDKKKEILNISKSLKYNKIKIDIFENKGRDIYPFIKQMKKVYKKYDYILKLHTKKTEAYNKEWFKYLMNNLIGNSLVVSTVLDYLNKNGGIVFPTYHKNIIDMVCLGGNRPKIEELLKQMNLDSSKVNFDSFDFPAGSMFYAESKALKSIFELDDKYMEEDYDNLANDGTYAHAIERLFGIVSSLENFKVSLYKIK